MFRTLCKLVGSRRSGRPDTKRRPRSLRLALEHLEDRVTPAGPVLLVNMGGDPIPNLGRGTDLRQAVASADTPSNAGATITFSQSYVIVLTTTATTGGELTLSQPMTITGPSPAHPVTIEGANKTRIFNITTPGTVTLANLIIKDGNTGNTKNAAVGDGLGNGGGIYDGNGSSILVLNNDLIENNTAVTPSHTTGGNGGGVYTAGVLTLNNTTVEVNTAGGNGGGIYALRNTTLNNGSLVTQNTAAANGGGIYQGGTGTTVTLNSSSVTTNKATVGNGGGIWAMFNIVLNSSVVSGNLANGATATDPNCITTETNGFGNGGGVYSEGGNVTGSGATVTNNTATGEGGGIWADWDIILTASMITNNVGDLGGGGMWADDGFVKLFGTLVMGNTAGSGATLADGHGDGGGIWSGTDVTIDPTTLVTGNNANGNGGGIYALRSVTVNGGTVSNNTATTACYDVNGNPLDGDGGGIYALVDVTVNGGNVSGNTATLFGGGIYDLGGNVDVNSGSTIGTVGNGNVAGVDGGGIWDLGGNVYIDSSSVGYNFADHNGGGVWVSGSPEELGSLYVNNSTFTSNVAVLDGGAIFVSIIEAVTVNGSTFIGNSATNGGAIYATGVENVAITNSFFSGNYAHSGSGGALYVAGPVDLYLLNDNFIGNSADVSGGAVYLVSPSGTTLTGTIYNCNFDDNVSYGGAHSGSDLFVDSNVTVDLNLTDFDDTPIAPAIAGPSASLGTDLIDVGNSLTTASGGTLGVINSSGGNTVWDNSYGAITNFGFLASGDVGNDQS